jgi:Tfp pilus assembly protein PilF
MGGDAIKEFQEVLRLDGRVIEAHIHLARLYLAQGNAETAAHFAREAVRIQPQSAVARLLLANAQAKQGDLRAAESELTVLSGAAPSSSAVHASLGSLHLAKRDLVQARRSYVRALELDRNSIEGLAGLTKIDLAEKKYEDVRARLERRLTAAPEDIRVLLLAGTTFLALNDPRSAESMFKQAIQTEPSNLGAYEQLARLYVSEGRLDEARRQFEDLARRDPDSVAAATMVGTILELQGRPEDARRQYEMALAVDPEAAIAANNLAWAYAKSGENLDAALRLAQLAKAKMPDRHEVHDTLGWIYYKKGIFTLAIASLKQSVTAQPDNPVYLYHLGLAYAENGDDSEARRVLEQALRLETDFDGADEARRVLKSLQG